MISRRLPHPPRTCSPALPPSPGRALLPAAGRGSRREGRVAAAASGLELLVARSSLPPRAPRGPRHTCSHKRADEACCVGSVLARVACAVPTQVHESKGNECSATSGGAHEEACEWTCRSPCPLGPPSPPSSFSREPPLPSAQARCSSSLVYLESRERGGAFTGVPAATHQPGRMSSVGLD